MARQHIFADESGDFTFSRGSNISRFFIVCTVTMDSCDVGTALLNLRRDLAWRRMPIDSYFHCTTDKQSVRDEVFKTISEHDFSVQATVMEKSKARPPVRTSNALFYKYGWLYHFRFGIAKHLGPRDELLITTASVGTKKGQAVFTDAVNDVIQQHVNRSQWATLFCPSASDPCLQAADYCTWAIQRKWERNDDRAYELIKNRITYENDLWKHSSIEYY